MVKNSVNRQKLPVGKLLSAQAKAFTGLTMLISQLQISFTPITTAITRDALAFARVLPQFSRDAMSSAVEASQLLSPAMAQAVQRIRFVPRLTESGALAIGILVCAHVEYFLHPPQTHKSSSFSAPLTCPQIPRLLPETKSIKTLAESLLNSLFATSIAALRFNPLRKSV